MTEKHTPMASDIGSLCDGVTRLVAAFPDAVRRVRMSANGVEVEMEWSPGTGDPGPEAVSTFEGSIFPADDVPDHHLVLAPLVGTYYHAPEPGAAPFVSADEKVVVGQRVALVEVMKMMVPIESDKAGNFIEHLVPNGEAVEFGQPLLAISLNEETQTVL